MEGELVKKEVVILFSVSVSSVSVSDQCLIKMMCKS